MSWTNNINLNKVQEQADKKIVLFVRLYAYFVNSATEHRKDDQKHSKGNGKVTPIKEILCVVYYNFYRHLVLWDNIANISGVLSLQAV